MELGSSCLSGNYLTTHDFIGSLSFSVSLPTLLSALPGIIPHPPPNKLIVSYLDPGSASEGTLRHRPFNIFLNVVCIMYFIGR